MPGDVQNRQSYLLNTYERSLEEWQESQSAADTISLGWAIIELDSSLYEEGDRDGPQYPREYFEHLLTMDANTLRSIPSLIMEAALELEPSMRRHYGVTRIHPVVLFKEPGRGRETVSVIYFGGDL